MINMASHVNYNVNIYRRCGYLSAAKYIIHQLAMCVCM